MRTWVLLVVLVALCPLRLCSGLAESWGWSGRQKPLETRSGPSYSYTAQGDKVGPLFSLECKQRLLNFIFVWFFFFLVYSATSRYK